MIPKVCPYYETIKCAQGFESEEERKKYEKRHCFNRKYLNCTLYSFNFFADFIEKISETDSEKILEKIVEVLSKK